MFDCAQGGQLSLFPAPVAFYPLRAPRDAYAIATTPEVDTMLAHDAVVAIGVSGGKDSQAAAIALVKYLDEIGHTGPRVLIHADLGVVEWRDSLPVCERLAQRLNLALVVVRRAAGDMMDRWEARWESSVERYASLSCVKLILPWSTPGMRFCTSELKTAVICRELTARYPGKHILSVTGVRHAESAARAKMPIAMPQPKLSARKSKGMNWNPIARWSTPGVYAYLEQEQEPLHEAYTRYGSSRVSCTFCIMGSASDLRASAACADNAEIYRRMVRLEATSTFAFQGAKWLGDVAPHLLTDDERMALEGAKRRAARRVAAEAMLPAHLLFTKGWPTTIPTAGEAELIAEVRHEVATAVGIKIACHTPEAILAHYESLIGRARSKR